MDKISTVAVLQQDIDRCSKAFDDKIKGVGGKRAVMVCGGTGCLANDSDAILKEFEKQIKEKGLEKKVSINHVGCFGFCSQGPFIKIFPEDTLYHKVKVSDVSHIVDDDLIGGKV
ncbi:MAG: (2Fe-2S) ferredoxin domain-containing protein, partial [Bacilli bacterium]